MVASRRRWSLMFAPAMTAPKGPPCSSTSTLCLVPGLPRSVGFLPTFFPPETGLAHAAVGTLPVPVNLAQFVALGDEASPDLLHHTIFAPALEAAVDGGVVAELFGQMVPLTARAEEVDGGVEHRAPGLWRLAALASGLPVLMEDGQDARPQFIGDFPDGVQRLRFSSLAAHGFFLRGATPSSQRRPPETASAVLR